MSYEYKNVMEILVEEELKNLIPSMEGCTCEQCLTDIAALALNRLPVKYVSTHKGELFSRTSTLRLQNQADIIVALTASAKTVHENPRHDEA